MEETKQTVATTEEKEKKGFLAKFTSKTPVEEGAEVASEPKPKKTNKVLKVIGYGALAALAGFGGYLLGKGKHSDDCSEETDYEEYSTEETEE